MKKLQFFVCYSLSGLTLNHNISTPIEISVLENYNAYQRTYLIMEAIVNSHNTSQLLINNYGYINKDRICVNCLTRLD